MQAFFEDCIMHHLNHSLLHLFYLMTFGHESKRITMRELIDKRQLAYSDLIGLALGLCSYNVLEKELDALILHRKLYI